MTASIRLRLACLALAILSTLLPGCSSEPADESAIVSGNQQAQSDELSVAAEVEPPKVEQDETADIAPQSATAEKSTVAPTITQPQDVTASAINELQPIFSDDFSKDTRGDYTIAGDVMWAPGRLVLKKETSVSRTIGGTWMELELDLEFPKLGDGQSKSETELRLKLNGAPDLQIVWSAHREGTEIIRDVGVYDSPNSGLLSIFSASRQELKRWPVDSELILRWKVTYRYGMVTIGNLSDASTIANVVYVENSDPFVKSVTLRSDGELRRIFAHRNAPPAELNGDQHRQLAKASAANTQMLELYQQGKYPEAENIGVEIVEILTALLGPDHPGTAMSLNNLSMLYKSQGNYAAAEPFYRRALEIREKSLGPDHPDTAASLNNLALLYLSQGNYAAAEPLLRRALEINEKSLGPDHPTTALSLNNLAELYGLQANYAAAEPFLRRALEIQEKSLGSDHPQTAVSLNNLALLYHMQLNYAAAEPLLRRALEINEKSLGPDHPGTARSLTNLASLYKSQGNYAAAEPLHLRALKIKETSLGPDHPTTAMSLNNLAELYRLQLNYAAAAPLHLRALKINEKFLGPDHPDTALSLKNLAYLYWEQDQAAAAAPLAKRTIGIELRHLDATAAIQTELQQFLMANGVSQSVGVWLTSSGADPNLTPAVYRDVLAWKGLITARQQGLRLALKDDPLFTEFRQVTQQLSTISLNPPVPPSDPQALVAWKVRAPELRRNWENQKATLEAQHERLEKELAVKSVPFRQNLEQRRMQPDELVATLKAQDRPTALVDVLQYSYVGRKEKGEKSEGRVVAFVVRGDRPIVRVELGSADAIAEDVAHWREGIEGKQSDEDHGAELRKQVWLPLEAHLQGIETVLISPDGPLAQLPWGALPGEQPGSYLLEQRAIAVIPVPQMLPLLSGKQQHSGPPESLLLAGDIEYGGDSGPRMDLLAKRDAVGRLRDGSLMQFSNLPAAKAELAVIEGRYREEVQTGKISTLENHEATEAAFSEQAAQHQWLHVITHGYFAPETVRSALQSTDDEISSLRLFEQPRTVKGENPGLLSGLAFAGANTSQESEKSDGILTALEVESLQLNEVDMVVLSACETGLGKVAGGEGLLGLQRAFQVAGANTCVASLWKVPDAATAKLMELFYENLWEKKMGKLDALREAQLTMLRQYDPESDQFRGLGGKSEKIDPDKKSEPPNTATRLDPRYWAAFQLSGDWR